MTDRKTLPYGAWRSPITSELIVGETLGLGDIRVDGRDIYWIEGRPSEGGRNVLVRRAPSTSTNGGGSIEDITPAPYSVRTRVHEYGGGAMNVHRGVVYFTNFADQRLYQQADIAADGSLASPRRVAGGDSESVFQPQWSPDGVLYFVTDRSGWWNLYRCDANSSGAVHALCSRDAEFGQAQWNFAQSTYAFLSAAQLVCAYTEAGHDRLARLDIATGKLTPVELPYSDFGQIRAVGDRIVCRAGSPADPPAIVLIDPATGASEMLRSSASALVEDELRSYISAPQHLSFPTENGLTAHANFFPPHNPDYAAPAGEKPPLVVKCHGGPTASASSVLNLRNQFWTSRGIAVLDVDYGGSTGYGRAYRERLKGDWGIVDVEDCVNAARHVISEGMADGERAVITGGSAGGYTVLAALTRGTVFKGGASYYGVSDVAALARDTHKFECRYLDWL